MLDAISSEGCGEKSAQGKSASSRPARSLFLRVLGSHRGVSPSENHHNGDVEGPEGAGAGVVDVANVAGGGRTRAAARGPPLPAR